MKRCKFKKILPCEHYCEGELISIDEAHLLFEEANAKIKRRRIGRALTLLGNILFSISLAGILVFAVFTNMWNNPAIRISVFLFGMVSLAFAIIGSLLQVEKKGKGKL